MQRQRLPNRRRCEIAEFQYEGQRYVVSIGRFADGGLAEIFLDCGKFGAALQVNANDAAILASLSLQHGVRAETIQKSTNGPMAAALEIFLRAAFVKMHD